MSKLDKYVVIFLKFFTFISIAIFFFVIFVLVSNTFDFFTQYSIFRFFFELDWDIQAQNSKDLMLGILPVLNGTFVITAIALIVSVPIAMGTGIFLNEYMPKKLTKFFDVLIEVAIAIPTIAYGYFGITFLSPLILKVFYALNISINIDNALTAGIVLGIMILPLITSFTVHALMNVPNSIRNASMKLGATKMETILNIVIPYAKKDIIYGILFGLLKAIGETLIIIMLASNNATLGLNPTKPMTTITAQIINLINSDGEFGSARFQVAYALALILFIITAFLNYIIMKNRNS